MYYITNDKDKNIYQMTCAALWSAIRIYYLCYLQLFQTIEKEKCFTELYYNQVYSARKTNVSNIEQNSFEQS